MNIYLVRHTSVAINSDYCYGISDVELADSRNDDMQRVKDKFSGISITVAYTSPLTRCQLLARELSDRPIVQDDLLEMDFGDWELKKWDNIDPKLLDVWMNDFVNEQPANGERFIDFSLRSVFFVDTLIKACTPGDSIVLITHSGVIRAIVCHVLNLSLAHAFNFDVDFGSVSKISVHNGWYKLNYLNH